MLVVILEYASKLLVFGMVDGFDDESKVPRVVEEGTALAGRSQFRKNIFTGDGYQVVCRIQAKHGSKLTKDLGTIILEFEVVLR